MAESFSLKDQLFNVTKVTRLADEISQVVPDFPKEEFIARCIEKFPELELKERISHMTDIFESYVGTDFLEVSKIILAALPPELAHDQDDNDFGDFIYAVYDLTIARHGCKRALLPRAYHLLEEVTKRFTSEGAVRYFFESFPEETLQQAIIWSQSPNYHTRRLASEGSRPLLPWCKRISLPLGATDEILDNLYCDPTTYVRRSVANHLHDISKSHPEHVFELLIKWSSTPAHQSKKYTNETGEPDTSNNFQKLVRHALRTLIKQGNIKALEWIGVQGGEITGGKIELNGTHFSLGDRVICTFSGEVHMTSQYRIEYIVFFPSKSGKMRRKAFKLFEGLLNAGTQFTKIFTLPLIHYSTRKLESGTHEVMVQVNGKIIVKNTFILQ